MLTGLTGSAFGVHVIFVHMNHFEKWNEMTSLDFKNIYLNNVVKQ